MTTPITLTIDGSIAHLTMDDGRANAIGIPFLQALDTTLDEALAARVVVVRGREKLFGGGLDLPSLVPLARPSFEQFLALFCRVHEKLLAYPRPIITVGRGSAVAGGAILLATGDHRLLGEAGKVGINEVALGLNLPTAAFEICRLALGDRGLAEAATTGRIYEGAERLRVGWATEILPADQLEARALQLAQELAAHEPEAVTLVRGQLRREALARVRAHGEEDSRDFAERWFSPSTQTRLKALVARLSSR